MDQAYLALCTHLYDAEVRANARLQTRLTVLLLAIVVLAALTGLFTRRELIPEASQSAGVFLHFFVTFIAFGFQIVALFYVLKALAPRRRTFFTNLAELNQWRCAYDDALRSDPGVAEDPRVDEEVIAGAVELHTVAAAVTRLGEARDENQRANHLRAADYESALLLLGFGVPFNVLQIVLSLVIR